MNEEAGFLAALGADPDDRTTLLVYADWLDERGDSRRAEFVRLLAAENWDWKRINELGDNFDRVWVYTLKFRCGCGAIVRLTGDPLAGSVGQVVGVRAGADRKIFVTVRVTSWGNPLDLEVESSMIEHAGPQTG